VKKFYALSAVIALSLFAASAIAVPAPTIQGPNPGPSNNNNVATYVGLNVVVPETLTLSVDTAMLNFAVYDPTVITSGGTPVTVTANYYALTGRTVTIFVGGDFINPSGLVGQYTGEFLGWNNIQIQPAGGSWMPLQVLPATMTTLAQTTVAKGANKGSLSKVFNTQIAALSNLSPDNYKGNIYITVQAF
jgi:hypothetical protein